MELNIAKINTDILGNQNIRTYIADKEDVIIDFIGMISNTYTTDDIEDIISRCICQGNSMDIGYQANNEHVHGSSMNNDHFHGSSMNNIKKTNYRIKFIDDYNRKVCIDV